jgi:acyl-CoA hydrolase
MKLSPYFAQLRSAYEAEINDMAFDSEGKNVLRQRLVQRRKELPFLRQMMASAPEMVAIVFHQGMRFGKPAAMDALVSRDASALPDWASLSASISLEPWAEPLAQDLCKAPAGEAFMVLAAAMEYLFHHTVGQAAADDQAEHEEEDAESEEEQEARAAEEAGNDWMAEQGFDRKE